MQMVVVIGIPSLLFPQFHFVGTELLYVVVKKYVTV